MTLLLLAAELTGLYFLSQALTQGVFDLIILSTRSRILGITTVAILTFPGTVIHELSHLFTAEVLGVHTGKLTLVPENLQEDEVRAGSVMIASTDPFRRYAIGVAPLFAGIISIAAVAYLLTLENSVPLTVLYFYLLFAVSSAMFSSKEDLKGFIPFAIAFLAMIAAAYVAGLRIGLTGVLLDITNRILDALARSLGIVLAINLAVLALTRGLILLTEKLTHRRLIRR